MTDEGRASDFPLAPRGVENSSKTELMFLARDLGLAEAGFSLNHVLAVRASNSPRMMATFTGVQVHKPEPPWKALLGGQSRVCSEFGAVTLPIHQGHMWGHVRTGATRLVFVKQVGTSFGS